MEFLVSKVETILIQLLSRVHRALVQTGLGHSTHANTSLQCFAYVILNGLGALCHTLTLQVPASVLINTRSTTTSTQRQTHYHQ